jgi:hypothetical protein
MHRTHWYLSGLLLLVSGTAMADPISDRLVIFDSLGNKVQKTLFESQEPGTISATFPGVSIKLPESGGGTSDTFTVSPFTNSLTSDADVGTGPDRGESHTIITTVKITSNASGGFSDILSATAFSPETGQTVTFGPVTLTEAQEAAGTTSITLTIPGFANAPLSEGAGVPASDTITSGDTILTLTSPNGTESGLDVGETLTYVLVEKFLSDVPEPSTLALLGVGLAGVLVRSRRRRM